MMPGEGLTSCRALPMEQHLSALDPFTNAELSSLAQTFYVAAVPVDCDGTHDSS